MGLKILHSADWHLDSPFQGFSESQRRFLKEAQRQIPGKITQLCHQEDCDMVLLAGGALSSPQIEQWRSAWLQAGPHPAAVLDPAETIEVFEGRGCPQSG